MKTDITVLMSTYNGEKYLKEQIDSVLKQIDVDVKLIVRDDGSSDKTIDILRKYQNDNKLEWYKGKNLKSAKSFLDLVENAPESSYYSFCDQDDIWKPEKLHRAVKQLQKCNSDKPALYCAGYQLVDKDMNPLPDNGHVSTTTFGAALVASNATGCTVVFNKKLREIIVKFRPETIVMHDDWVHKVCLAVGGTVIYDDYKALYYRQHGNNVDGGQKNYKKRIALIVRRIKSKDRIRSKQIAEIIEGYSDIMSNENLILANLVADYSLSFYNRIKLMLNKNIRTPYKRLNRGFKAAVLLGYF